MFGAGVYYNYDSSNSKYHDSIMADQMAGQWYLQACDLVEKDPDAVMLCYIQSAVKYKFIK